MNQLIDKKLENLGITVWKKKHQNKDDEFLSFTYLIENKYLLFFAGSDFDLNKEDIDLFVKTLSLSLNVNECIEIENIDAIDSVDLIFTFFQDPIKLPDKFTQSKVCDFGSIHDVCCTKESKINFFDSIQKSLS